jgi:arylsulfatase
MKNQIVISTLPLLCLTFEQIHASENISERPNIMVILADDMGFSDLGFCGSGINTPNIDNLAANGMVFSHFYNAGRSCPSRASLLTGLYAHRAGMGWMTSANLGDSGYTGDLNEHAVTIAQVLREANYACFATGKWHLTYDKYMKKNGKKHNWPIQRGFDRYFGHLTGGGSYYTTKTLTNDNERIYPPEDFYLTTAVSDSTVSILNHHFKKNKDKPFFFYVAYYAPHRPLQALQKDIDKYRGHFMNGWDEQRKHRYATLKKIKMINSGCKLSNRDEMIPAWNSLDNDEKMKWDALMSVYAAQIDCMDQGIGKIIETLKRNNALDNTLIIFLSDNGGCAEPQGGKINKINIDNLGKEEFKQSYRINWANVSNTPFREYKHYVHEGGIATPLIACWPKGIKKRGIIDQTGHLIDLMPTFIELAGAKYPETYNEQEIYPLQGISLSSVFANGQTITRNALFFEHEANRAVIEGNWKLVSKGIKTPPYAGKWELYNLKNDRSEMKNLIEKYPNIALALANKWDEWAKSNNVYPLHKGKKE